MNKNFKKSKAASTLRHKAEVLSIKKPVELVSQLSESEILKLIHELELHQIELEMQNEDLILSKSVYRDLAAKFIELYDFAPLGYFTLSKTGEIIELNKCGSQFLGKERSDLINSNFGFFVSDGTKPIFNLFLSTLFTGKVKESCDVDLLLTGHPLISVRITGIVTGKGEQCLVNVLDITESKHAEEEIKLKNEKLLKLNSEKDKFFTIIAHDLRNPLNSFLGLTEIMAAELPDLPSDKMQELAIDLKHSASNLFRLLENLLQWAGINQGLVSFNPEVVQLLPLVNKSVEIVLESLRVKGIRIVCHIPDDFEVYADSNILKTIIRNLVSNAVKFTPRGGRIDISAEVTSEENAEISIRDTGIGMSHDLMENLFRIGLQTNREGTEGEPSTGLGLIICKDLIDKLEGKFWIESEEGKGSDFRITLPHYTL